MPVAVGHRASYSGAKPGKHVYVFGGSLTLIVPRRWLVVAFHEPYYTSQGTYQLGTYFQQNLEVGHVQQQQQPQQQ